MKILGFEINRNKPEPAPIVINSIPEPAKTTSVGSFDFYTQNSFLPPTSIYSRTNYKYIKWGEDNLFPLQLVDMFQSSPIHQSIITQKAKNVIGEGIEVNDLGLDVKQKESLNTFLNFADGENSLESIAQDLSFDYQLFGQMALEVIWNTDFTRIQRVNRIPMMNVRLGDENLKGNSDEFYYSKDWRKSNSYTTIPAFNIFNKTSHNQIIYVKNPSPDNRYYGVPSYVSGLQWVYCDAAISKFHASNISQGFNPSITISFKQKPESREQEDDIVRRIKKEYAGQGNAGKPLIFFAPDKDLVPDVAPVQVSELDKQFSVIADQIVEQIVRSHRGVSPLLWGIRSAGQLGTTQEYENAVKIFEKTVLSYDRRVIENLLNRVLKVNGWNVDLKLKPKKIFEVETGTNPTAPVDIESQAKANLKGSVGGVQGILEIQKSVSEGVTDYTAALAILDLIYGISEQDAKRILGTPKSKRMQTTVN